MSTVYSHCSSLCTSRGSEPDFLALVCHELRTPLQTILGQGELLQREATDDTTRARLAAIGQHGALMLRLVNDLLDWRTIDRGDFRLVPKPVELGALVSQTVASCRPAAAVKGLSLQCEIAPGVPAWVRVDGDRVRQVLLNLVSNAIKFTSRGRIRVTLSPGPRGTGVELQVADTGPGIVRAQQTQIFRPFVRLRRTQSVEGVGLGLAVAARLCQRLGGDLTVSSDGRCGTTFTASFAAPVCLPLEVCPISATPGCGVGRAVLIADDNPLVRDLFAAHLRRMGAQCECVADGAQALARALNRNYAAVVLDLSMPGLDGFEVTRRLRAHRGATLRIVGATAHAGATERVRAYAAGMDAFLTKPVELAALTAALGWESVDANTRPEMKIRASLRAQFRREVAGQRAALDAAWRQRDWTALEREAHYVHNSASVVGDAALCAACVQLRKAALATNPERARRGWRRCEAALAPWLPAAALRGQQPGRRVKPSGNHPDRSRNNPKVSR